MNTYQGTCKRGHDKAIWWRTYPSMPNGRCTACAAETHREWWAKNREKLRQQARAWNQAHPEQNRERSRRWRVAHREHVRDYMRRWRARRKEASR